MWWTVWGENTALTAALLWLLVLGWGAGRALLRPFALPRSGFLEEGVLALGLGTGAISLVVLGLGLAGLFRDGVFVALLLLLTAAAAPSLLDAVRVFGRPPGGSRGGGGSALLAALFAAGALLFWLTALSPPLFYDALVYHLAVPNLFLLRGGIEPLPHVMHSNFPAGTGMLYALGIWAGGLRLAGLINFALGLCSALALAAFARRHWGGQTALTAAVLYYLTLPSALLSRYPLSENALSFYFLLALLCIYRWREEDGGRWVLLAGIFGGLAFGTRYVGGLFAVALPAVLIAALSLFPSRGSTVRRSPLPLALFLLGAAAASLPWLVKNALFTGNPLYPAFAGILGGGGWGPEQAEMLSQSAHAAWLTARSWKDWLLLPWHLAAGGIDLGAAAPRGIFWPTSLLCAAVIALRDRGWKTRLLVAFLAGYFVIWGSTFWMARFLLPASALGAAVIALLLREHLPSPLRGWPATAAVVLVVLFNGAVLFRDTPTLRVLRPVLGAGQQGEYLRDHLRIWPAVEFINRSLPQSARILVLGETKVAYLQRDHLYQTVFDRPLIDDLLEGRSPREDMGAALGRKGVTHVLVNLQELERLERGRRALPFPRETLEEFLSYLKGRGDPLFAGNRVFLFELSPSP